mmetsp:Transcript_7635/g.18712  ORF Transcript_7635/g.18712 Transcript_7635/m.18712 type:complete len:234 (-) Transcript_7635:45-746(-)
MTLVGQQDLTHGSNSTIDKNEMRSGIRLFSYLGDANRNHLDGGNGVVVAGADFGNLVDEFHVLGDLSKDGMGGRSLTIEPVEEAVVVHVEKKLGTSGFGSSGVGHAESSNSVSDLLVGLSDFIGDSSIVGALDHLSGAACEAAFCSGTSGSGAGAVGILRVGATKLVHKVGDHTVEVKAIVESRVSKVNEVTAGDWHLFGVQLGLEGSHRGGESGSLRHGDGWLTIAKKLEGQ